MSRERRMGRAESTAGRRPLRDVRQDAEDTALAGKPKRELRPLGPWATVGNCLLCLVMTLVIILSLGFWGGSWIMVNVLKEIRQRDYSGPMQRIGKYEDYFDALRKRGCSVVQDKPRIVAGVTTYLWTVQPKGRDDLIRFQWQHDLKTNNILPDTNAALLLDLQLGTVKPGDVQQFAFYNPNDSQALSLLQSSAPPVQLGTQDDDATQLASSGVLAPLISPEDAKHRAGRSKPAEETPPEDGTTPPDDGAGDAVPVNPGDGSEQPPADGGGSGNGDGGGAGEGGGGDNGGGEGGGEGTPVVPPGGG